MIAGETFGHVAARVIASVERESSCLSWKSTAARAETVGDGDGVSRPVAGIVPRFDRQDLHARNEIELLAGVWAAI